MLHDNFTLPSFDEVLEHLESLTDPRDQIAYLTKRIARVRQRTEEWNLESGERFFIEQCEMEIARINYEMLIYDTSKPNNDKYDPAKRGLTRQLAMMLMDELFPNLRGATTSAKADLLHLFTGFSSAGLINKWPDYSRGNKESLQKDREKVAVWKQRLGISD